MEHACLFSVSAPSPCQVPSWYYWCLMVSCVITPKPGQLMWHLIPLFALVLSWPLGGLQPLGSAATADGHYSL